MALPKGSRSEKNENEDNYKLGMKPSKLQHAYYPQQRMYKT
jgi:hypothetical protein